MRTDISLRNKILTHLTYWVVLVLFFTLVWGSYDFDFSRNLAIQLSSIPARALLVYPAIYVLFPRFILKGKYFQFLLFYFALALIVTLCVQRPIIYFFVQPNFLPEFNEDGFFTISVIMNTMLDVNIAALIPLGYMVVKQRQNSHSGSTDLNTSNYIDFKVDKSMERVLINEILYIESQKNYIRVITHSREIVTHKSLTAALEELPKEIFTKAHRSYIVNMRHIKSFSPNKLILKNDTIIPIGRKFKENVRSQLSLSDSA